MHIPAIILGKAIAKITRLLKIGGGSAAPGLYALKVDPNLVSKLSKKIPKNIIITGTNGKTTTSRMIAHFAKAGGLKVIRNHTGSNLERGIASALISNYTLYPKPYTLDLGIWELDEAAFNNVAPKLNPDIVVFLNIFRDQLDRYGEVDSVVKKWAETLKKLDPKTIVLVNGDDANTAKLGSFKFGVKSQKIKGEISGKKEQLNCWIKNVKLNGLSGSSFDAVVHNKSYPVKLPLPGLYHIYDFLAAFYTGHELGFDTNKMISSLKTFTSAFGRVEKLPFGYIFLIKNPEGATQVFKTIAPQIKPNDRLLIALNDNLADGTDVSWIWDAIFETFQKSGSLLTNIMFASGTRADDLSLRLKYAGFNPKQIIVDPSLENALRQARKGLKGTLYILPTYTAMLDLQRILAKIGLKKEYWNEK